MNNKIKIHQLKNIKDCRFKAYVSQFNDFKTLDNKSKMISKVYKNIIKDYDFIKLNKMGLTNIVHELLDDKYFLTNQEKEVEVNIIIHHLLRYITYEKKKNRKILDKNIYGGSTLAEQEIQLKADIVFENDDSIELVKFKTGEPKLSYKARTEKNLPENDIELYLLKKLGEKLYGDFNKPIIASYYHLKGKKDSKNLYERFLSDDSTLISTLENLNQTTYLDKKEEKERLKQIKEIKDVINFNFSIGNNIISFNYQKSLDEKIIELLNVELNFDSEKCKSSDCSFCNYSVLCNYENNNSNDKLEIVKEVKKSNSDIKLTDNQKQVVNGEYGNYRINAGAGSGKTSTVVIRVIELFKKGYEPNDILLITFTNKGAQELREKIQYWLNYYNINNINVCEVNIFTFNSFGDSIISKEWDALGFLEKPQLATTIDVNDIIKKLLQKEDYNNLEWLNYKNPLLNFPNSRGVFKQLVIYFNIIKSYGIDKLREKLTDNQIDSIHKMYNEFNQMLKAKNLLQYQDQILYLIELFKNNPALINTYGYEHIIVDEYQDTDFTQVELLHLLNSYKDKKSLMVIGDDFQSIYSFRNTTPENIINFDKQFDNVKDIYLLDNFRSTPEICNVANELIKLNTQRLDKKLIGKNSNGKNPEIIGFDTLENEYSSIIKLVKEQKNNIPLYETCIIARTKKELLEIQSYLNKENIPSNIEASELFVDNVNVQIIINLANFLKNNEHDYYLMEYLFNIIKEFKTESKDYIANFTKTTKDVLINKFNAIELEEGKIQYFYELLETLTEKDEIAKSFIVKIQQKTFYTFNQLLEYLYKINLYNDDTSIEKDDNKYNAITLTTAHSSKGKEWSTVITTINSFKYEKIQDDISELEEERRLLFVAITRAKEELYITYNTNQDKARNKGNYCIFADEIRNILNI